MRAALRLFIALMILLPSVVFAQVEKNQKPVWSKMGANKSSDFYAIQKDFNAYWSGKKVEKGKGYKVFKRWEAYMSPRVYPTGDMTLLSTTYANFVSWQNTTANRVQQTSSTANWTELGPLSKPSGYDAGVGRIDFVRFDPNNPTTTMYVGGPDGGLWKTTDGGVNWTTNTDFLPVIGCADLVIDPTNTQTMYLATGNWEYDRHSIGVLKSTDGGTTWNTTSLTWTATDDYEIRRLIMDPVDPNIMMVGTDGGVFRTTDGWATNTQVSPGAFNVYDMDFKPGDNMTVYAVGTEFMKSTDNGATWATAGTGLPAAADVSRGVLAVTAANPNYVYIIMGNSINSGYLGTYRSTNSGTSFSLRSDSPDLLNSAKNPGPTDLGGQATHDLAIAVSPANAELVTIGGINQWQSIDGGQQWSINSYWLGDDVNFPLRPPQNVDYVHADIQDIQYLPGSNTTMFATCDGGISKSTNGGLNWTDISHNLRVAQQTNIALSATTSGIAVTGLQDIGTRKRDGANWSVINGGDGEPAFIDYTNDLNIVTSNPNGNYDITFDGSDNRETLNGNGLPDGTLFYSQISQDPVTPTIVYAAGRPALYKSTNVFSAPSYTWSAVGTPPGTGSIVRFAVAPSAPAVIYAFKEDAFSKSIDGGANWSNITNTLPVGSASLTNLAVSNTDANKVWVTFSGYSDGNKVFRTTDGGATWTNISTGLPNLPINTVVYKNNTANDEVYIGADIGVYYLDNTLSAWVPFFTDLARCAVTDLEIFYPTGKLRASTYGRGSWESDLFTQTVTCPANFAVCLNTPAFALTGGSPAGGTYSGTGVNAGVFNPATAGVGPHTITYTNGGSCTFTISVSAVPVSNAGSDQTICASGTATLSATATNGTGAWTVVTGPSTSATQFSSTTSATAVFTPAGGAGTYTLRWTVSNAPCPAATDDVVITVNAAPTSNAGPDQSICASTTATLAATATNGTGAWTVTSGPSNSTAQFSSTSSATAVFTPAGGAGTYTLRWTVSNAPCPAATDDVVITVNAAPTSNAGPDQSICASATATLAATATNGTGAWTVTSGPSTSAAQFSNTGSATAVFTPVGGAGTYTLRWTVSNAPCPAATDEVVITVTPGPASNAGPDQTICASGTATLAATATNGTGAWTVASGPSTLSTQFSNTGSATAVFTPAGGTGTYTLRWTVSNAPCPAATDDVVITVNAVPSSNAGPDQSICASATATLAATATNGTGAWTVTSGPSTSAAQFSNTSSATAVFTPAGGAGTYTLRWTVSNAPCPAATDEVVITVTPGPASNAGPDQTICASGTATLAAIATNGTGAWTVTSGPSTLTTQFSNTGSATAVFTPAGGAGTYTLRWTVSNAPCPAATDEVVITVNAVPTSNAGSDQSICASATATLAATATNGTGAWTVVTGPSTLSTQFSSTSSAAAVFTPAGGAGTYTLRWTVSNAPCPAATDDVVITVTPGPASNAGPDQTICASGTATLAATATNGTGAWTVTSGPSTSTAQFSSTSSATAVFTPAGGAGTYTLRWTVSNAPCPAATDEVVITVNAAPTSNAGPDQTICASATATLAATATNGTGAWTVTSGPSTSAAQFSNTGSATAVFTPAGGAGTYTLRWTVSNAPCPAAIDEVVVLVNALPTVTCPGNISVCLSDPAFALTGGSPAGGIYSGTGVSSGTFNPASAGVGAYTITYSYTNGNSCTGTCTYTVTVSNCSGGTTNISGRIISKRDNTTGVKDVTVVLSGDQAGSMVTPANGNYSFPGLSGSNFMITPDKNLNKLNGVNAADVYRINQHATLNPLLISDPYELVAADVNNNNVITPLDANIIQLSLLGNPQAMAQFVKSWRFVPTTYVLNNPPWGFPEKITLTGVSGNQANQNFYGIKIGDVAAIYANPANGGAGNPLVLRVQDQVLEAGQTIAVDFESGTLPDIAALQFALRFDPKQLRLADLEPLTEGLPLSMDNFGLSESAEGLVRFVWAEGHPATLKTDVPVFRLLFEVLEGGQRLSEMLALADEILPGSVYDSDLSESAVWLRFDAATAVQNPNLGQGGLQLFQNRPNPFVHKTTIGFVLPEACEAQLRIVDVGGRVVAERQKQYPAGLNAEIFELNGVSGVLYYELTTPFGVLARKMVVVE